MKRLRWLNLLAWGGTVTLGVVFWGSSILMLGGCDGGTRKWTQTASDTRAACQAAPQISDPAARLALYDAIGRNVLALTDGLPLPKPTQTPERIVANQAPFTAAAAQPVAKMEQAKTEPMFDTLAPLRADCRRAIEWGAIIGVLGTILWGVSLFIDPATIAGGVAGWALGKILGLSFIWRIAASAGGVAVVVGAAGLWTLNHPWVIVGAIVCGLAWVGLVHHRDVAAAWHRILGLLHATVGKLHGHSAPAPKPTPPSTLIGK